MSPDLLCRIAAIKAHQAPWHAKIEPNRELLMVGQKVLLAAGDFARREDDIRFIAASRNTSPAMARVVVFAINSLLAASATITNDDILTGMEQSLESIANQWEGTGPCSPLPAPGLAAPSFPPFPPVQTAS